MPIRIRTAALAAAVLLTLAGCGGGDEGRAGLTADQERELNEAAAMLDEGDGRDVIDASPDSMTLNEADFADEPEDPPPPAANGQ